MEQPTSGDILLRGAAHQRRAGQQAADLHGVPVAGAVSAQTVGENIEFSLKIRGVDPADPQGARAGTDAAAAPAGRLLRQERHPDAPAASASASRWPARSPSTRRSCSSTSRCRRIDYKLRKTLEKELKDIHRETGKTFVYITHSLEEAMVMSRPHRRHARRQAGAGRHAATRSTRAPTRQVRLRVHGRGEHHRRCSDGADGMPCDDRRQAPFNAPAHARRLRRRAIWSCGPEFMRFLAAPRRRRQPCCTGGSTTNTRSARASSIRCASASKVFIVEKLRQQAFDGAASTTTVLIGWDAARQHPGERLMTAGTPTLSRTVARAGADAVAGIAGLPAASASPRRCWRSIAYQLHAAAHLRPLAVADAWTTTPTIFDRQHGLHLVRSGRWRLPPRRSSILVADLLSRSPTAWRGCSAAGRP